VRPTCGERASREPSRPTAKATDDPAREDARPTNMNPPSRPTRYRFWVLAALCSLAFLTYLDRICIMRVQGEIERDLGFAKLTQTDEQSLRERGLEGNAQARSKLANDRATTRMSWVFSAFCRLRAVRSGPAAGVGDRWWTSTGRSGK